jgi:hypothetical protein
MRPIELRALMPLRCYSLLECSMPEELIGAGCYIARSAGYLICCFRQSNIASKANADPNDNMPAIKFSNFV